MKLVECPSIHVLNITGDPDAPVLYFYDEVHKVYFGYRQCYSNSPELLPIRKEMPNYEEKIREMRDLFQTTSMYRKRFATGTIDPFEYFGEERFANYVAMCEFISRFGSHGSPQQHAHISVQISDVSRTMSHQHVRHRIAAHSQASQRYIDIKNPTAVLPPSIAKNAKATAIYSRFMSAVEDAANELRALNETLPENEQIPKEDIRFIYPNAYCTSVVTTMNFFGWKHYFHERACQRSQWEIRTVANELIHQFRYHIPFIFDKAGSKCLSLGYCPEGSMCCGRFPTLDMLLEKK